MVTLQWKELRDERKYVVDLRTGGTSVNGKKAGGTFHRDASWRVLLSYLFKEKLSN